MGAALAGFVPGARADVGTFTSSDPLLNSIWADSIKTATDAVVPGPLTVDSLGRACAINLPTVLVDGPDRDRCPYVIDQAVTGMTLLISTPADAGVLRDMLVWYAQNQEPGGGIPVGPLDGGQLVFADSGAYWIEDLYDYVLYTGDLALAQQLWPDLVELMDVWYPAQIGPAGLVVNSLGPLDYGLIPRLGTVVSYYNALYVRTLTLASDIAGWLNEPAAVATWRARIGPVASAFAGAFWDGEAHAFVDSTAGPVVHPEDGNVFAILAGLAAPRQARSALDYLSYHDAGPYGATIADNDSWDGAPWGDQASQRVYPFISYFEVLARYEVGFDDSALALIRREWGNMAEQSSTMWETVGASGTSPVGSNPSWDHGWSSGAAPALTNEVLGIRPASPGFATFAAVPHPSGLSWARGAMPTPHGTITFSWTSTKSRFVATISSPVPGRITLPVAGPTTLDGRLVSRSPHPLIVTVGGGTHVLVVVSAQHQR
jgi:Bacterial alpha-L-rhamnosidase C-terminal domain/Bacterial alpha-L-rhamnosidase 6 hairpin glycosidase domain